MTNLPSKRGLPSFLGDLLLKSGDDSGKSVAAREGSGVKFSKRLSLVVDDLVKESTRTGDTIEASSSDDKMCEKDSNMTVCASQTDAVTGEDLAMTVFSSSNSEETGLLLSNSQTIKSFSMNRCSNVDGMGIVDHNMEADDQLKSCSCSFCLKAAYVWSDLHYQDIKGRLSVLKKSQKEASSLIRRNGKGKPTDIYGSENSNNSTNTENVMDQWSSLFLNMEGILSRESNHLQKTFVAMKELRENCKIDLERATKTPQHNNI